MGWTRVLFKKCIKHIRTNEYLCVVDSLKKQIFPRRGTVSITHDEEFRLSTYYEERRLLSERPLRPPSFQNFNPMSNPSPAATVTDTIKRMQMSQSGILNTLRSVREPIVGYQESRGVSRNESISFVSLMTSLCTQAYTAGITILVMLWNLAPLLDGFIYFARFVLDKLIDIFETTDQKEKLVKCAIFTGEIIVVLFLIFLIMGLIFMPVYVLTARILHKVWGMIAW